MSSRTAPKITIPPYAQGSDVDGFVEKMLQTEAYTYFLSLKQMSAEALQDMLTRVLLFLVEGTWPIFEPCVGS